MITLEEVKELIRKPPASAETARGWVFFGSLVLLISLELLRRALTTAAAELAQYLLFYFKSTEMDYWNCTDTKALGFLFGFYFFLCLFIFFKYIIHSHTHRKRTILLV